MLTFKALPATHDGICAALRVIGAIIVLRWVCLLQRKEGKLTRAPGRATCGLKVAPSYSIPYFSVPIPYLCLRGMARRPSFLAAAPQQFHSLPYDRDIPYRLKVRPCPSCARPDGNSPPTPSSRSLSAGRRRRLFATAGPLSPAPSSLSVPNTTSHQGN